MDGLRKSSHNMPPTPTEQKPATEARPRAQYPKQTVFSPNSFPSQIVRREKRNHPGKKVFLTLGITVFIIIFGILSFFLYKSVSLGRNIRLENAPQASFLSDMKQFASALIKTDRTPLLGEKEGRINILLLGRAGEHYPGQNLTDTIILMSIDTTNKKVSLLSLPRDLYVEIPETSLYTKINSLYQYGLSNNEGALPLRTAVENITGQKIHYFFDLDFDGFEQIINALHGISVDVVRDFYDPRYPGKNYSYETFEIKKGWQTLDGATALKYVRERHNDPEGDFGRAKRQQQVIQAIKDKAFSLGTFLNIVTVNNVLTALGENVRTDMPVDDMEKFLELVKTLDTKNVTTLVVDAWKKESLLRVSHIQVGPVAAFILIPRIGTWNEIRDMSDNIFHLDAIKIRQDTIKKEKSSLILLAPPTDAPLAQKMKTYIMEEMGFDKVTIVLSDTLKNQPEKSIVRDRTNLEKLYSLDELIRKFSLKKEDTSADSSSDADFVLTLGKDLENALSFDGAISSEVPEDASFPEVLPPQPKN